MSFDYGLWRKRHTECVLTVQRFCELDKRSDAKERSVKCNSALCVMKNAMQDIRGYFQRDERSSAELCFLIRNIDVIVAGILDINNILFGIGLNRADKAIERCFWLYIPEDKKSDYATIIRMGICMEESIQRLQDDCIKTNVLFDNTNMWVTVDLKKWKLLREAGLMNEFDIPVMPKDDKELMEFIKRLDSVYKEK